MPVSLAGRSPRASSVRAPSTRLRDSRDERSTPTRAAWRGRAGGHMARDGQTAVRCHGRRRNCICSVASAHCRTLTDSNRTRTRRYRRCRARVRAGAVTASRSTPRRRQTWRRTLRVASEPAGRRQRGHPASAPPSCTPSPCRPERRSHDCPLDRGWQDRRRAARPKDAARPASGTAIPARRAPHPPPRRASRCALRARATRACGDEELGARRAFPTPTRTRCGCRRPTNAPRAAGRMPPSSRERAARRARGPQPKAERPRPPICRRWDNRSAADVVRPPPSRACVALVHELAFRRSLIVAGRVPTRDEGVDQPQCGDQRRSARVDQARSARADDVAPVPPVSARRWARCTRTALHFANAKDDLGIVQSEYGRSYGPAMPVDDTHGADQRARARLPKPSAPGSPVKRHPSAKNLEPQVPTTRRRLRREAARPTAARLRSRRGRARPAPRGSSTCATVPRRRTPRRSDDGRRARDLWAAGVDARPRFEARTASCRPALVEDGRGPACSKRDPTGAWSRTPCASTAAPG